MAADGVAHMRVEFRERVRLREDGGIECTCREAPFRGFFDDKDYLAHVRESSMQPQGCPPCGVDRGASVIGTDPYLFVTLWRQYRACRRHKRNAVNALRFEVNAEENLLALQQELRDRAAS